MLSVETYQTVYFFSDDRLNQLQGTDGKKMIVNYSLDELDIMLDPAHLFRVNRSFIVSIRCIDEVQTYFGNRLALRLMPAINKVVVVSREKLTPFKEWLGK